MRRSGRHARRGADAAPGSNSNSGPIASAGVPLTQDVTEPVHTYSLDAAIRNIDQPDPLPSVRKDEASVTYQVLSSVFLVICLAFVFAVALSRRSGNATSSDTPD